MLQIVNVIFCSPILWGKSGFNWLNLHRKTKLEGGFWLATQYHPTVSGVFWEAKFLRRHFPRFQKRRWTSAQVFEINSIDL